LNPEGSNLAEATQNEQDIGRASISDTREIGLAFLMGAYLGSKDVIGPERPLMNLAEGFRD
jgi:hypothetical protein